MCMLHTHIHTLPPGGRGAGGGKEYSEEGLAVESCGPSADGQVQAVARHGSAGCQDGGEGGGGNHGSWHSR